MRKFWIVPLVACVIGHLFGASPAAAAPVQEARAAAERTVQELERVRDNPLALREFLKRMPKGADLHNHLDGAVYAETFIRAGAEDKLCIVHVTLHAGELAPGLVPPEGLCCHIRLEVEVAKADRIGHGVGIVYEDRPYELMKDMAAKRVMVEINLTSNDMILGIKGTHHPFSLYRKFGVPVALSTDDEGVSRIDLTHEYVRAVETYDLSYADLKQFVRNSLEYSFLPGASLWASPDYTRFAGACENDGGAEKPSSACEVGPQG